MQKLQKILFPIFARNPILSQQIQRSFVLLAGNLLKILVGLVASSLVLRALGPEQAGRMALVLNVIGLFAIIGEFGLRDAAVNYLARFRQSTPDQATALARAFFFAKFFLSLAATTTALLGAGWIANRFFASSGITSLLRFAAFTLLTNGLLGVSMVLLEAQQNFGLISKINIAQASIRAALIAVLFWGKQLTLPVFFVLEALLPFLVFLYTLRFSSLPYLKANLPLRSAWNLLFNFTRWLALSTLFTTISTRLDVLLLSYFHAPIIVGLYAASQTLIVRLNFVKGPILTTAFAEACRRTTPSELKAFIRESLILSGGLTLLLLPLLIWGDFFVPLIFGASYAQDKATFVLLMTSFLIGLNVEPISYILFPLNKASLVALRNFIQLLFTFLAGIWLIPRFGATGAALSVLTNTLVFALLSIGLIYRFLHTKVTLSSQN